MKRDECVTNGHKRPLWSSCEIPESERDEYDTGGGLYFRYRNVWHCLSNFMRLRYPSTALATDYWHATDGCLCIRLDTLDYDDGVIVGIPK